MKQFDTNSKGFTIVELLIVIVVIGILAAISIVTYSGIRNRANDTTVQSDLRNTQTNLQLWMTKNNAPPLANTANVAQVNETFIVTRNAYNTRDNGNSLLYCRSDDKFAVLARSASGNNFYVSSALGSGSLETLSYRANSSTVCPLLGVATSDPGYGWRWQFYQGSWREDFTPGA